MRAIIIFVLVAAIFITSGYAGKPCTIKGHTNNVPAAGAIGECKNTASTRYTTKGDAPKDYNFCYSKGAKQDIKGCVDESLSNDFCSNNKLGEGETGWVSDNDDETAVCCRNVKDCNERPKIKCHKGDQITKMGACTSSVGDSKLGEYCLVVKSGPADSDIKHGCGEEYAAEDGAKSSAANICKKLKMGETKVYHTVKLEGTKNFTKVIACCLKKKCDVTADEFKKVSKAGAATTAAPADSGKDSGNTDGDSSETTTKSSTNLSASFILIAAAALRHAILC